MDQIQPQQNKAPQSATGYTNLGQYLGANQNNQLGKAVAGGVQQAGQAATGAINQAGQQFQQGVQTEQNRLGTLGQNAQTSLGNLGNVQQSDIDTYQSALSGQGQGPKGLANQAGLQQQSQAAQQLGGAGGSEAGRFGLLQRYVGGGKQYNLGQQTLDSAILGQTGQNQLRQARAATSGLGAQANQAIAAANAQGQQLQNQAGQVAQTAQQNLGTQVTGYDTGMTAKVASDKQAQQDLINQLSGKGTNAAINLDPALLQKLSDASAGVLGAGTHLYNADISKFLQGTTNNLNNQGVQSSVDFAKIQALGKLAGNSGLVGQASGDVLNQYLLNPTAVGAYDKGSPISITSESGLNDTINAAKGDYDRAMAFNRANAESYQNRINQGEEQHTNLTNALYQPRDVINPQFQFFRTLQSSPNSGPQVDVYGNPV